jgi:hypothetical protein
MGDGTGSVEVCCGQRFTSQAGAEKEAQLHCIEGEGWVAIAKIVKTGVSSQTVDWKDV